MGVVGAIVHKLRYLFVVVYGLVRRAFCCFKRKQRPSSTDEENEPLQSIVVQQGRSEASVQEWGDWTDMRKPMDPVQRKIEDYRANLTQAVQRSASQKEEDAALDVDYFSDLRPACADMVPRDPLIAIAKQRMSNPSTRYSPDKNRLNFNPDTDEPLLDQAGELGEWTDEAQCDWEVDETSAAPKEDKRPRRGRVREKPTSAAAAAQLVKKR